MNKLAVNLGFKCNFQCAHCANGFEKKKNLFIEEKKQIVQDINTYKIRQILFVGGEPFLYITDIQYIINKTVFQNKPKVIITTNGSFAKNKKEAIRVLSRIPFLKKIQLSYDKFGSVKYSV